MGQKKEKGRSKVRTVARKVPLQGEGLQGRPLPECPDRVTVGAAAQDHTPAVGQTAALTLAGGEVQLVVGGRVVEILTLTPDQAAVSDCLGKGESYFGSVDSVDGDVVHVTLGRVSPS